MAVLVSLNPDELIPVNHPIHHFRRVVDMLADLNGELDEMYESTGRRSAPPEVWLKAMYSMRSERSFCERLNYNLLFKVVPGHAVGAKVDSR